MNERYSQDRMFSAEDMMSFARFILDGQNKDVENYFGQWYRGPDPVDPKRRARWKKGRSKTGEIVSCIWDKEVPESKAVRRQ